MDKPLPTGLARGADMGVALGSLWQDFCSDTGIPADLMSKTCEIVRTGFGAVFKCACEVQRVIQNPFTGPF